MALSAQPGGAPIDPIADLISQGRHRDATAMCASMHGRAVGRFCMALLGTQGEAEEAAQEAFLAAHRAMSSYRGDGTIRSWLFGIARRICARRLETSTRREQRLRLVHDSKSSTLPDEMLAARRRADIVRAALEQLKPSEREAVLLRYESGLSYREIADACGIDEATARKRASRALARLRVFLDPNGL